METNRARREHAGRGISPGERGGLQPNKEEFMATDEHG
jgi:hypothetical protein